MATVGFRFGVKKEVEVGQDSTELDTFFVVGGLIEGVRKRPSGFLPEKTYDG